MNLHLHSLVFVFVSRSCLLKTAFEIEVTQTRYALLKGDQFTVID